MKKNDEDFIMGLSIYVTPWLVTVKKQYSRRRGLSDAGELVQVHFADVLWRRFLIPIFQMKTGTALLSIHR